MTVSIVPNTPAGPAAPAIDAAPPFGLPHTIGAPEPAAVEEQAQPTAEELRFQQLEQTNQQILQQNNQLMQMLMQNRTPAGPAAPQVPQPPPALTFDGLPDAVSAPKDFNTQLAARIQQREQQQAAYLTHNITTQVARGAAMDNVFNRFSSQHSELAKRASHLQGAAILEFQQLQAQGIDPVSVAMQNPDSLVGRIAARMNSELGTAPAAPGGQQHGAPMTPYSPPTAPNAARAVGVQGGSGMPVTPRAPAPPKSFVDQLIEARQKSGVF